MEKINKFARRLSALPLSCLLILEAMLTENNSPVECNPVPEAIPDVPVQHVEADVGPGALQPFHEDPPFVYVKVVRNNITTLVWCLPIEFVH